MDREGQPASASAGLRPRTSQSLNGETAIAGCGWSDVPLMWWCPIVVGLIPYQAGPREQALTCRMTAPMEPA